MVERKTNATVGCWNYVGSDVTLNPNYKTAFHSRHGYGCTGNVAHLEMVRATCIGSIRPRTRKRLPKGFVEIEDTAGDDAQHHSFVDPFGLEGVKPALAHGDTE